MSNARLIRWLRIGWVVLCFVPTLLLAALWVRSYWRSDLIRTHVSTKPVEIISTPGRMKITRSEGVFGQVAILATYSNNKSTAQSLRSHVERFNNSWGLGVVRGRNPAILLPYWFFVLIVGMISCGLARIRWSHRFSMRTMLITMTLLAVGFGITVVAVRGGR